MNEASDAMDTDFSHKSRRRAGWASVTEHSQTPSSNVLIESFIRVSKPLPAVFSTAC
jgi:hypothetical protein